VHTIQQWCDRTFAILPFEKAFYQSYGYDVDFVGHPILDAIAQRKSQLLDIDLFRKKYGLNEKPVIALLPGSRKHEIKTKLPKMLQTAGHFPDYQLIVAGSETVDRSLYKKYSRPEAKVILNDTYNILNHAEAALVTSGTATLETALFRVPQVVCYKPGYVTYHLLRRIISIKYICMVNLIVERMVVEELIEGDLNEKQMVKSLKTLFDPKERAGILSGYDELERQLGGEGASERVAQLMIEDLRNQSDEN